MAILKATWRLLWHTTLSHLAGRVTSEYRPRYAIPHMQLGPAQIETFATRTESDNSANDLVTENRRCQLSPFPTVRRQITPTESGQLIAHQYLTYLKCWYRDSYKLLWLTMVTEHGSFGGRHFYSDSLANIHKNFDTPSLSPHG
jgi:hypothetical protein